MFVISTRIIPSIGGDTGDATIYCLMRMCAVVKNICL